MLELAPGANIVLESTGRGGGGLIEGAHEYTVVTRGRGPDIPLATMSTIPSYFERGNKKGKGRNK